MQKPESEKALKYTKKLLALDDIRGIFTSNVRA